MINRKILEEIRSASVEERIHTIEIILESLRKDMANTYTQKKPKKRFEIQKFHLGGEVHVDRDELYEDRIP